MKETYPPADSQSPRKGKELPLKRNLAPKGSRPWRGVRYSLLLRNLKHRSNKNLPKQEQTTRGKGQETKEQSWTTPWWSNYSEGQRKRPQSVLKAKRPPTKDSKVSWWTSEVVPKPWRINTRTRKKEQRKGRILSMSSWDVTKGDYVTLWIFGCFVTKSFITHSNEWQNNINIYIYIYI